MKISLTSTVLSAAILAAVMPMIASAHEHQTFRIGDKTYSFTVGSLNEPVAVDDKSGVELSVSEVADAHGEEEAAHVGGEEHAAATPVLDVEKTMKVEVSAGGKKRAFDLVTQYGKPGSYKAVFIPTVQTTLTYRFFGTINTAPVDLSFTCNPAGHAVAPEDNAETPMGEGVVRVQKSGAFGCPVAKADLGFPEPATTLYDLRQGGGSDTAGPIALGASVLALIASIGAWKK